MYIYSTHRCRDNGVLILCNIFLYEKKICNLYIFETIKLNLGTPSLPKIISSIYLKQVDKLPVLIAINI